MDTETGIIRELDKKEELKATEILISEREKEILSLYKEIERVAILKGLRSKNNSTRRRANRLIQKGVQRDKNGNKR